MFVSSMREPSRASRTGEIRDDGIRWFKDQLARAKKIGIFAVWGTLTPALARHIIAHHMPPGSNRRLRPAHVAKLASIMRAGNWNGSTHQGLAFTSDDVLNDGQHRVHGCAAAGRSVEIMITFGQPRHAFEVIDQDGAQRDAATLLELDGIKCGTPTHAAGLVRGLIGIERGATGQSIRTVQKADVLDFARRDPKAVHQAVLDAGRICNGIKSRVSPSNVGAAMFLIRESSKDNAKIEEFITRLATGANLGTTSPVLMCREGLRAGVFGGHLRTATDRRAHETAAIVNAWNLFRIGKTIRARSSLSYDPSGSFPKAVP